MSSAKWPHASNLPASSRAHPPAVRGEVRDGRYERSRAKGSQDPPMGKEVAVNTSILIRRCIGSTESWIDGARSIVR